MRQDGKVGEESGNWEGRIVEEGGGGGGVVENIQYGKKGRGKQRSGEIGSVS